MANLSELKHLLHKCLDAKRGGKQAWSVMSTGEKLAVAVVLNQPAWITEMHYSLPEAIERIGPEWLALIPLVERGLSDVDEAQT